MEQNTVYLTTHPSVTEFWLYDYDWCHKQAKAWADEGQFEMAYLWSNKAFNDLQSSHKKLEDQGNLFRQQVDALQREVYELEEELSMKD